MREIVRFNVDGRPTFLEHDGWRVSVATMDDYHLREWKQWKQRLKMAHPDFPGGLKSRFQVVAERYRRWKNEERVRYGKLGLRPPTDRMGGPWLEGCGPHATQTMNATHAAQARTSYEYANDAA